MKRLICIVLAVLMIATCFVGCGDKKNETPTGSESDDAPEQLVINPSDPGNSGTGNQPEGTQPGSADSGDKEEKQFLLEDIDPKPLLTPLETRTVQTPAENVKTSKFTESTLSFDEDAVLAGLQKTKLCNGIKFLKGQEEYGKGQDYGDIGQWYNVYVNSMVYKGYPEGETYKYGNTVTLQVEHLPNKVHGISCIQIMFSDLDLTDPTVFQEQAEEALTVLFGSELAHCLVYMKSSDEERQNPQKKRGYELNEEVSFEDDSGNRNYYNLIRAITEPRENDEEKHYSISYYVTIGNDIYNTFSDYHEDYPVLVEAPSVDIAGIFDNRLGSFEWFSKDCFTNYMKIGNKNPYTHGLLMEYAYAKEPAPDGRTDYVVRAEYYKGSDLSYLLASRIIIKLEYTEDADGNIVKYDCDFSGLPDCVVINDGSDNDARMQNKYESYEKILEEVKEQLKLVFGDKIDLSDLKVSDLTKHDTYDGTEADRMYTVIPAKFTFAGNEQDVEVELEFNSNFMSAWYGEWSFEIHLGNAWD